MAYQNPYPSRRAPKSGVLTEERVMTALAEKPTTIFKLRKRLGTSAPRQSRSCYFCCCNCVRRGR